MELLLGQSATPSIPGAQPVAPPGADILNAGQFLNPQNYRMPQDDQISPYPLATGTPGPFARVDGLKGLHAMLHGSLGRMPHAELSQPLPGTAPPPGTNIPIGPLQNLPDPSVAQAAEPIPEPPVPAAVPATPVPPLPPVG